MARISVPPDWRANILQDPGRWGSLFHDYPEQLAHIQQIADSRDGYLHWTKFRHKRPFPSELTREEAWGLVRTARLSAAKPLPFKAKNGTSMTVSLTDPLHASVRRIIAHRKLRLAGLPEQPNAQITEDMKSFGLKALIDEAYYSAVIEGAVTTRRDARKMIREAREPRSKSEQMILNNYNAGRKMIQWIHEPMTPSRLCELQDTLTAQTLEDEADSGQFRSDMVYVKDLSTDEVVHAPPPAEELAERIERLCNYANQHDSDDPVPSIVQACILHYQLAYDHPFGDGNGRTARWLFLWRVLRCPEYWWFSLLSVSRMTNHHKQAYYDAFRFAELDNFDVTYLVRQQLQSIEGEMAKLASFLTHRQDLATHARLQLRLGRDLNQRQLALFDRVRAKPDDRFTQKAHARFHGVTHPTARQDLEALVELDLLERQEGRPVTYSARPRFVAAAREFRGAAAKA